MNNILDFLDENIKNNIPILKEINSEKTLLPSTSISNKLFR